MLKHNQNGRKFATLTTSIEIDKFKDVLKLCQQRQFKTISEFLRFAVFSTLETPQEKKKKFRTKKSRNKTIQELLAEIEAPSLL